MKKPTLRKLPKAPKKKTIANMERYVKRLEAVQSANKKKLEPYEAEQRRLAALQEKARKLREKGRGA